MYASLNKRYILGVINGTRLAATRSEGVTESSQLQMCRYTNAMVVGYREDPVLFKKCLESFKNQSYELVKHVYVIVDGNDPEDQYMVDIFNDTFRNNSVCTKSIFLTSDNPEWSEIMYNKIKHSKYVCISQPHKGKRHALYTGFKMSLYDPCIKSIMCSDSDTMIKHDAIEQLALCLNDDTNISAATGNVKIYNKKTFISFMSSLRYWYACNLERACQSYNGCVLCVSGPLGIYRISDITEILDKWITQKFLGVPCTYGDDRHLTNLILSLGKRVVYTSHSECYTETPETFNRWFIQQTRWCKSSYREFLLNIKWLHKHSYWMTLDITYQMIYSLLLILSLVYILFLGTYWNFIMYMYALIALGFIKSIYAVIMERKLIFFYFSIYGILYLTGMIPAKLYSMVTLNDVSWGTSTRLKIIDAKSKLIIPVIWNCTLLGGMAYNLASFDAYQYIFFGVILAYIALVFVSVKMYIRLHPVIGVPDMANQT